MSLAEGREVNDSDFKEGLTQEDLQDEAEQIVFT